MKIILNHIRAWRAMLTLVLLAASVWQGQAAQKVFVLVGDAGEGTNSGSCSFVYDSDMTAVRDMAASWNPDFWVTVGDNNYLLASYGLTGQQGYDNAMGYYFHDYIKYPSGYSGCFSGSQSSVNKFFPVAGNHDWDFDGNNTLAAYTGYFELPGSGISVGSVSSGNERYYDFIQGAAHFFVLDSDSREPDSNAAKNGATTILETEGTITPTTAQAAWLKSALAASTAPWKFVVFHHPPTPYSSGSSLAALKWPFQLWGADAVLNGHVHAYERIMHAVDGSHPKMPFITSGLLGRSKENDAWPRPTDGVTWYRQQYGAVKGTVDEKTASFAFYTTAGTLVDSVYLVKTSGAGGTIDSRIAASTDDAEENQSTTMDMTSSDLEMVDDTADFGSNQKIGMRFQNIAIPKGSIIRKAWVQFVAKSTSSGTDNLTIKGEAADNAATFSSSAKISTRSTTTASVSWSPNSWGTDKLAGPDERTPDLASVVQEIVNRSGWSSGNALAITVTGSSGVRRAYTWNNADATLAPQIHIEWDLFQFTTQPQSQIVNAGSGATFTVAVTGSGTFSYQWRKNGSIISGAPDSSSYTISSCASGDAATYDVIVTSSGVSMTSDSASLGVITTQPQNKIARVGSVQFTVAVTPSGSYTYQWHNGSGPISGATSSSLTKTVESANAGTYYVVVSKSGYTSGTSHNAEFSVVTVQPAATQINSGETAEFSVTVVGPTVSYQWKRNGTTLANGATGWGSTISGATLSELEISSTANNDLGYYVVFLSNGSASWYNGAVYLTFNTPPSVTVQRTRSANPGNTVFFKAIASGTAPITYQWKKGGSTLSNGGVVSGATTDTLTLTGISTSDAGSYTVVADNVTPGTTESSAVTLTVDTSSAWTLDGSSDLGTSDLGMIYTHLEQPDGKILVGSSSGVTRFEADGTADTSFTYGLVGGSGSAGPILALALSSSGQIYASGGIGWYSEPEGGGSYVSGIVRLNSDGSLDWSFAQGGSGPGSGGSVLGVQSSGDIIAGASTRLTPAYGYLDSGFNTYNNGVDGLVRALIVVPSDDKIIVGGDFYYFDDNIYSGAGAPHLLLLNSDGTRDNGFSGPATVACPSGVYALALQSDGKLLAGGNIANAYGSPGTGIARFSSSGSVDTGFDVGLGVNATINAIALDTSGKVYVGGAFTTLDGVTRNGIARLTTGGALDAAINPGTGFGGSSPAVYTISRSSDGSFIVSGNFTSYNSTTRYGIVRLNAP